MKYSFLLILSLFSLAVSAQRTIRLPETSLNLPSYGFRIDSVADARVDQSNIGHVQTGPFNSDTPARFPTDLSTYLTDYFRKSYAAEGEPLVLVVDRLQIREETGAFKEVGIVEAKLVLCRKTDGKLRKIAAYTGEIKKKGLDVTNGHGKQMAALFEKALSQLGEDYRQSKITP